MTTEQQNGHRPNSDGHNPNSSPHSSRSGKGTFINSGRKRPCPLCDRTKDGDCSWTQDEGLVMCYELGKEAHPPTTLRGYTFKELKDGTHGPRAHYTKGTSQHRQRSNRSVKAPQGKKLRDGNIQAIEINNFVENEVTRLAMAVSQGEATEEDVLGELAAFCIAHNLKEMRFSGERRLKRRLKDHVPSSTSASEDTPRLLKDYRLVEQTLGNRLRLNETRKEIEIDGKPINADTIKLDLQADHALHLRSSAVEDIRQIIVRLARENSYSPVIDYLNQVSEQHRDTSIIDSLATRYFGTDSPIYNTMVKRFLIAAVARAIEPGCKHDSALILQGPQEARKSTWLKTLASAPWFCDDAGACNDKDETIKMHCRWIVEWAELETLLGRRAISKIKAFMTSTTDFLRAPYGRVPSDLHRQFVISGTTNKTEFLKDPTGSRRFWVVPVRKRIDINCLKRERDQIWAAATICYRKSERWWWEPSEDGDINALNSPYQEEHPWKDVIASRVDGDEPMSGFTTQWVLSQVIGMDIDKQKKSHQNEVGSILRELGFELSHPRRQPDGSRPREWEPKF